MILKICCCRNYKCLNYQKEVHRYIPDRAEILDQLCKHCNEKLICESEEVFNKKEK